MSEKTIANQLEEAVAVLRQHGDRMEAEAKKYGEATVETKTAIDQANAKIDELELKLAKMGAVKAGEPKTDGEAERRAFQSKAFFKYVREGKSILTPDEKKALVENTTGLYLIPEDLEAEIIRSVPQLNTLRNYCRVRTTNRDKLRIRTLGEVTVGWGKLELGTEPSDGSPTPTSDYIYVEDLNGLAKIGVDELEDSDANLQQLLVERFRTAIVDAEHKAFAVGQGHTTYEEPAGVAVDATIIASYKSNWSTADTVLIDDMLTCEYNLPAQYLNGAAWLMNRKTELALRKLRAGGSATGDGAYLWSPGLTAGAPNNFDGYPIINQNDMNFPADATVGINVIFGNFKLGYCIVDRKGIAVQRLDELYAEAGMVGFLAHRRVGGDVIRPDAFYGIYNNT